jgi:hypothetical protein
MLEQRDDLVIHTRGVSKQAMTQSVCDELHRIASACSGGITPDDVLRNAKSESSPIHDCFEWDDTVAGEKFRFIQAAMLIRSVKVRVETHPQEEPKIVRAFVSVTTETDKTDESINKYVPLESALRNEGYRHQMIENALRELKAFQRKYALLSELSSVIQEIERLHIEV